MFDTSFLLEGENYKYVEMIGKYYVLCGLFHVMSTLFSYVFCPAYLKKDSKDGKGKANTTLADKINWDYTVASIFYCAVIFYLYVAAVIEIMPLGVEGRWTAMTFNSTNGIAFHIASSLYETTCYVLANKGLVFYLHHVVTVGGCSSMLFFGRASFWCCVLGLIEGTNIPLGIVLGGPFKTTPAIKNSILYKLNGILLWVLYLIIRVPMPIAMWFFQKDLTENGLNVGKNVAWLFNDAYLNNAWIIYMYVAALFIWGLSLMWFTQITNGMLKALGLAGKKSSTKKAA